VEAGHIRISARAAAYGHSILRDLLARARGPDLISFAVGTPATDLLPTGDLAELARDLLVPGREARTLLQYGMPSPALKREITHLMALRGVACRPEQVFLTAGSQQGMALLAHLLLDPDGTVVLEEAIYDGILMAIGLHRPRVLTVPTRPGRGIDLDALEALLADPRTPRPAFLYVVPAGHNPTGSSLSLPACERLAAIARHHRLPILEDDAYGLLDLDGEDGGDGASPPALRSLDDRWVLYLGSLSKVLAPGLRVGWIVAPEGLIAKLSALKHGADVDSTNLGQHLAARFLADGRLSPHLERLRTAYRERRDTLLAALGRRFAGTFEWRRPRAGMFVWVELPEGADAKAFLEIALDQGVAFCPGLAFAAGDPAAVSRHLRLSYADNTPDRIEAGAARLARAWELYSKHVHRTE
jgi:2-aminoadipate transaminase